MLKVGEIAFDKYRIISMLGQGGMGCVYLAENINVGNKWAIKEISVSIKNPLDLVMEPEMLKRLNHPNLPRIIDVINTPDSMCIIEDYFEGQNLRKTLENRQLCSEVNVIRWARQLAEILIYLHNLKPIPIIYSDLKPANIIIDTNLDLKLVDFGISRESSGSSGRGVYGSPGYAAPEQYQGVYDARTDIFSFGATFYHVLTGGLYEIEKPLRLSALNDNFSAGIDHIITKCLSRDPKLRYQNAAELFKDLNYIDRFNSDYKKGLLKKKLAVALIIGITLLGGATLMLGIKVRETTTLNLYQQKMETAAQLTAEGKYAAAEASFKEALNYQDSPAVYQDLARLYLRENKAAHAMGFIKNEIDARVMADDAMADYLLGSACFDLKDYSSAVAYFQQSTTASNIPDEDWELAMRDLAVSYSRLNNYDEAEAVLERLDQRKLSNNPITSYIRGEIYLAQHNFTESLSYFEKAHSGDPNNPEYMLGLGRLYSAWSTAADMPADKIDRLEKAQAIVKQGEKIDPYNIQILSDYGLYSFELGQLYESAGNGNSRSAYQAALLSFTKLKDLGMADSNTVLNLAMVYDKLGNYQLAETNFQESLSLDEGSSHTNFIYGLFKLKHKEYSASYQYLQKTVDLNKNSYEVSVARARIAELREKGWI